MDRRRLVQLGFTAVFILFLLLLVLKFKPRIEAPAPLDLSKVAHTAEGTLSAKGFTYTQMNQGKTEYTATASEVTETQGGLKLLTEPVVVMANGARAWGNRGSYSPAEGTLRVWEDAHLSHPNGWTAASSGFRLTPEGELVSEAKADLKRGDITGRCLLMRYHRETERAHLEGEVHFEQGPKALDCVALDVDLSHHTGKIEGPVALAAEEGTLRAPNGTLALDDQNRLKGVTLGTPATGDGPRFSSLSRTVRADFDEAGAVKAIHLEGGAEVTSKGAPPSTMKSDPIDLTPKGSDWAWTAVHPVTILREGGEAHANSGNGVLGKGDGETADLAGPIAGRDQRGNFTSDKAAMRGGDWTLIGHSVVTKPGERVTADRTTLKKDGTTEASGSVHGFRSEPGGAESTSVSDFAQSAPKGFPARLTGHASVTRGGMKIEAPTIVAQDEDSADAEGGAKGTFSQEGQDPSVVTSASIHYAGKDHVATAKGSAKAMGRGYTLTGDLLRAVLDKENRPIRYEAEGKAVFTGTLYDGNGDFMTYDPAAQAGRAFGKAESAVVIQKTPYRRVAGSVVDFAPKHLEALPDEGSPRRGSVEGIAPPKKGPDAEKSKAPLAKEKH